jgi:hypothetical protein
MGVREALGRAVGGILAPVAAEASLIRGAAVFHADGVVYRGEARAIADEGPLGAVAHALEGPTLVRFSGGLQRYHEGRDPFDVFGASVRFHPDDPRRMQDLLFGTFRHAWQIPFAALLTNRHDVLANDFYAVLPFHVPGTPATFTFRLVPEPPGATDGKDHRDRLDRAVATGKVVLSLEASSTMRDAGFAPIAAITLHERLSIADGELRFNPFHDGAGVVPAGFFQAIRAAVYPASQLGRSLVHSPKA